MVGSNEIVTAVVREILADEVARQEYVAKSFMRFERQSTGEGDGQA